MRSWKRSFENRFISRHDELKTWITSAATLSLCSVERMKGKVKEADTVVMFCQAGPRQAPDSMKALTDPAVG